MADIERNGDEAAAGVDPTTLPACQNCGSPLYGEHCYACGQPTRGLVRHFSSILGDAADTLLNIDGRIFRTLPALLLRPGFLSNEYFAGHRVRYVSPVRLFVFLCIATFFAAKLATPSLQVAPAGPDAPRLAVSASPEGAGQDDFAALDSVEAVESRRREALAGIAEGRKETAAVPGMGAVMAAAENQVNAAADRRLAELRATPAGAGPDAAAGAEARDAAERREVIDEVFGEGPTFNFNGRPWHATENPVAIDGVPAFVNAWLNAQIGHVPKNWSRIREDPDLLRNAFYSALPTALFVLVPVFALLLKALYVYKRRLYMEHLVTALHGHAFLCAMLLVMMGLSALERGLGEDSVLVAPLAWAEWLAALWIPVYLWLLLRRVYRQGWWMTSLNYGVLGVAQLVMLSFVASGALLVALIWL